MIDVREEMKQAKRGCLITQIAPVEFKELVVQLIDESLDIVILCKSDRKKDRIRAKKLLALSNLFQQSPDHLTTLLNTKWTTLFFRSSGNDIVSVELEIRGQR